jgi:Tfp pilus assembly PilM family ATPase
MMTNYQKDSDLFFQLLDEISWIAGKREAVDAKIVEAQAAGVKASVIYNSIAGAQRDYPKWRRQNLGREVTHGILSVEDEIMRRLQCDIDQRKGTRPKKDSR